MKTIKFCVESIHLTHAFTIHIIKYTLKPIPVQPYCSVPCVKFEYNNHSQLWFINQKNHWWYMYPNDAKRFKFKVILTRYNNYLTK